MVSSTVRRINAKQFEAGEGGLYDLHEKNFKKLFEGIRDQKMSVKWIKVP